MRTFISLLRPVTWTASFALLPLLLVGCGGPADPPAAETEAETSEAAPADESAAGSLVIRANGEDFVREGFVTKDGWEVSFDHVYVTLAEVTAYQSDPAFDAEAGSLWRLRSKWP